MSSTNTGKVFNLQEAEGVDLVQHQTTAATAQAEAPTSNIAREVEHNAEIEQEAARKAAAAAKSKVPSLSNETPSPTAAVNQLQKGVQQTTDAAVAEGQHDVEAAKAQGATYLEQAKSVASNVASTVQSYLPASVGGQSNTTTTTSTTGGASTTVSNVAAQAQAGATAAIGVAGEYLAAAQKTAQPHIEKAKDVAQSYLASGEQTSTPASSTGIPAATHSTTNTATTTASNVAAQAQSGATAALGVTKEYLASAQKTAQPHIEKASDVARSYLASGEQPTSTTTSSSTKPPPPASSTGIPAVTRE